MTTDNCGYVLSYADHPVHSCSEVATACQTVVQAANENIDCRGHEQNHACYTYSGRPRSRRHRDTPESSALNPPSAIKSGALVIWETNTATKAKITTENQPALLAAIALNRDALNRTHQCMTLSTIMHDYGGDHGWGNDGDDGVMILSRSDAEI